MTTAGPLSNVSHHGHEELKGLADITEAVTIRYL